MSSAPTITKLEAANRQLCTAIRMFFADDDAVAVHTLACAAREIYEKHCHKVGLPRMFDFLRVGNPEYSENELRKIMNGARTFFKHAGESLGERIEFDDVLNDFQLLSACWDCNSLCPQPPTEVLAYLGWFRVVVESSEDDTAEAARVDAEIERRFPNLKNAPRAEKRRFGQCILKLNLPNASSE